MAGIRLADTVQRWMMLHSVDRAFLNAFLDIPRRNDF